MYGLWKESPVLVLSNTLRWSYTCSIISTEELTLLHGMEDGEGMNVYSGFNVRESRNYYPDLICQDKNDHVLNR